MGTSRTLTEPPVGQYSETSDVELSQRRLEILLAENAYFADSKHKETILIQEVEASVSRHPISTESAVAGLGLLTGLIPTTAILIRILIGEGLPDEPAALAIGLLFGVAIAATSAAGYYSGKVVGRILSELENKPWPLMMLALPFVGIIWGLLSGTLGGIVIFGIGAIFGGSIGALIAPAVLTFFGLFHRILKTGDVIERSRFLPIAFGITLTIAAFILGL